eukprot:scaffold55207_cov62-Attheya_sp.AAC.1
MVGHRWTARLNRVKSKAIHDSNVHTSDMALTYTKGARPATDRLKRRRDANRKLGRNNTAPICLDEHRLAAKHSGWQHAWRM